MQVLILIFYYVYHGVILFSRAVIQFNYIMYNHIYHFVYDVCTWCVIQSVIDEVYASVWSVCCEFSGRRISWASSPPNIYFPNFLSLFLLISLSHFLSLSFSLYLALFFSSRLSFSLSLSYLFLSLFLPLVFYTSKYTLYNCLSYSLSYSL